MDFSSIAGGRRPGEDGGAIQGARYKERRAEGLMSAVKQGSEICR